MSRDVSLQGIVRGPRSNFVREDENNVPSDDMYTHVQKLILSSPQNFKNPVCLCDMSFGIFNIGLSLFFLQLVPLTVIRSRPCPGDLVF